MEHETCRKSVRSIRIFDRRLVLKFTHGSFALSALIITNVSTQALGSDLMFAGTLPLHDELMSGKKSKKPLRPLEKHLLFGIPANIAAGPLGFRAELDVNPKGERICPHRGLRADRTDPTAISDEKNPNPSRIVFRRRESEPQGSPVPGTSTAVDIEPGDHLTSEYSEPCHRS